MGLSGELQGVDVYFDVVGVRCRVGRDLCWYPLVFCDRSCRFARIQGLEDLNGRCYPRIIHLRE
jgi:hypothetical protein